MKVLRKLNSRRLIESMLSAMNTNSNRRKSSISGEKNKTGSSTLKLRRRMKKHSENLMIKRILFFSNKLSVLKIWLKSSQTSLRKRAKKAMRLTSWWMMSKIRWKILRTLWKMTNNDRQRWSKDAWMQGKIAERRCKKSLMKFSKKSLITKKSRQMNKMLLSKKSRLS